MSFKERKWYDNLFFEFHLEIPLFSVHTRLFRQAFERDVYDICRLHIKVWKWKYEFELYKRPHGY